MELILPTQDKDPLGPEKGSRPGSEGEIPEIVEPGEVTQRDQAATSSIQRELTDPAGARATESTTANTLPLSSESPSTQSKASFDPVQLVILGESGTHDASSLEEAVFDEPHPSELDRAA